MADQKISELTAITGANTADDDLLVIVDTSTGETKKITKAELTSTINSVLIDGAPATLDTLNELAAALADDANFASTVTTSLAGKVDTTGDSMTGDLTFGDNDKAIFGAGSDLQIYHDGSNSLITDQGTGNLRIQGTNITLESATGEYYMGAVADGTVGLYHNNSQKLATTSTGIDVTGTATMDGLTVDGDATISSTAPRFYMMDSNTVDGNIEVLTNSNSFLIRQTTDDKATSENRLGIGLQTGDISFYEDTGTTAKFFWDASAESLGIGTSSPDAKLEVTYGSGTGANTNTVDSSIGIGADGTTQPILALRWTAANQSGISGNTYVSQIVADTTNNNALEMFTTGATPVVLGTNATERMRIDSSGNLLVGTTSTNVHSSSTVTGVNIMNNGYIFAAKDNDAPLYLNRRASDGNIAVFNKGGVPIGSIGVNGNDNLYLAGGSGDTRGIYINNTGVHPAASGGTINDASNDLGTASNRWNSLYLSGGVYLGGTGAANYLDDYEEGSWTPTVGGTWTTAPTFFNAVYTKIGRLVHIRLNITSNAAQATSTSGWIDGLPFNVANNSVGSVSNSNVGDEGNCLAANTTRIWLTDTALTATAYVSISYFTTT